MLDKLTVQSFEPLIGQKILLDHDSKTIELEVTDVEELPPPRRRGKQRTAEPATERRKPFSVMFFAEAPMLPQAMYAMRHETFGSEPLQIFIVPIGEADGGFEYEAVFT